MRDILINVDMQMMLNGVQSLHEYIKYKEESICYKAQSRVFHDIKERWEIRALIFTWIERDHHRRIVCLCVSYIFVAMKGRRRQWNSTHLIRVCLRTNVCACVWAWCWIIRSDKIFILFKIVILFRLLHLTLNTINAALECVY